MLMTTSSMITSSLYKSVFVEHFDEFGDAHISSTIMTVTARMILSNDFDVNKVVEFMLTWKFM